MLRPAVILLCLVPGACAHGPTLGRATEVTFVSGSVFQEGDPPACRKFDPTIREVTRFLNSAVISSDYVDNGEFMEFPCYVQGTAVFRGRKANWTLNGAWTMRLLFYTDHEIEDFLLVQDKKGR